MSDANRDENPPWNDDLARQFIGKHIIIGITYLTVDKLEKQPQMYGDVEVVDQEEGHRHSARPPDLRAIKPAKPASTASAPPANSS